MLEFFTPFSIAHGLGDPVEQFEKVSEESGDAQGEGVFDPQEVNIDLFVPYQQFYLNFLVPTNPLPYE